MHEPSMLRGFASLALDQWRLLSSQLLLHLDRGHHMMSAANLPRPLTNQAARGQAPVRPPQLPPVSSLPSLALPPAATLAACT